jgi:hypothetical protein
MTSAGMKAGRSPTWSCWSIKIDGRSCTWRSRARPGNHRAGAEHHAAGGGVLEYAHFKGVSSTAIAGKHRAHPPPGRRSVKWCWILKWRGSSARPRSPGTATGHRHRRVYRPETFLLTTASSPRRCICVRGGHHLPRRPGRPAAVYRAVLDVVLHQHPPVLRHRCCRSAAAMYHAPDLICWSPGCWKRSRPPPTAQLVTELEQISLQLQTSLSCRLRSLERPGDAQDDGLPAGRRRPCRRRSARPPLARDRLDRLTSSSPGWLTQLLPAGGARRQQHLCR